MKAYSGITGNTALILNLLLWLPYHQRQSTQYQLNMRLGDPRAGLDILVDSKNLMPLPGIKPQTVLPIAQSEDSVCIMGDTT